MTTRSLRPVTGVGSAAPVCPCNVPTGVLQGEEGAREGREDGAKRPEDESAPVCERKRGGRMDRRTTPFAGDHVSIT